RLVWITPGACKGAAAFDVAESASGRMRETPRLNDRASGCAIVVRSTLRRACCDHAGVMNRIDAIATIGLMGLGLRSFRLCMTLERFRPLRSSSYPCSVFYTKTRWSAQL